MHKNRASQAIGILLHMFSFFLSTTNTGPGKAARNQQTENCPLSPTSSWRGADLSVYSGQVFSNFFQQIVPDLVAAADHDGAHQDGQGWERQADWQGHPEIFAAGDVVPDDVAPHLHRREGEEGALDLAHADAHHREAGPHHLRLTVEDTLQQLPERRLHD